MTYQDSGYSMGEADALLAPLVGIEPADIIDWALVAFTNDHEGGSQLRVSASAENNLQVINMLAQAIAQMASDLTGEQ